ncbi:pre-mRNA-splicing factor SYF2-like [Varroa jacobsoni]|uniref:Pre-mRNA-splicing factor SYF2 n=1 Tax=Varroa destructor TaxID=109461 RepID=A0A7M7KAQ7_VARDE|nr:pre-mRNA-splicing factor SYF2-like [Varroa destructor]XP_022664094.1 pre-mRNA-splicing factor SYF2-like [Varroa destructor]XP_022664099.1 pre-mRNA-splicing factor SYF2-like [Varroa destructor]XP_022664106.1 pre-mRNA-splicing factor SYF2-like [Varroa destructor]XP_022664114.1 pre-mRNA-splicing factor SYF2-like [Varroa destructor]XP_022664123.1 pre-mRNA-splicing factor SYF2-like [Varroa destructor]XP_022706525.1 pre-mRNA-splicing factor SYF2-like [Varroa jacobsoni]XP_022706526.1 pre-mRNA-sp
MSQSDLSGSEAVAARMQDRMERLRALHMRKTEASRLNHQEVIEEDRRSKLPKNFEEKQYWAQYKLDEEQRAQAATARGGDYDIEKLRNISAEDADRMERARKRKQNHDKGFSSFEAATARQYHSLVDQIRPDMEDYEAKKQKMGSNFFPTSNTVIHGTHQDSPEALERLSKVTHQVVAKREKFSRRRRFDPDADVDFINERNQRFNKKLERFYSEYTKETKLNLERGTAL